MNYAAHADSSTWKANGTAQRRHAPDEETNTTAYWTIENGDGSYWAIGFDKRAAEYSGKLWKPAKDGDGEVLVRELTVIEALGFAMFQGLYCTGLEGSFKDRDPREGN